MVLQVDILLQICLPQILTWSAWRPIIIKWFSETHHRGQLSLQRVFGVVISGAIFIFRLEKEILILPYLNNLSWNAHGAQIFAITFFLTAGRVIKRAWLHFLRPKLLDLFCSSSFFISNSRCLIGGKRRVCLETTHRRLIFKSECLLWGADREWVTQELSCILLLSRRTL